MSHIEPWKRWVLLAVAGLVSATALAVHAELPPAECLRLVRAGRAAALAGDAATATARLRDAHERFPKEFLPLTALLDLEELLSLPDAERAGLESGLLDRLRDPQARLPLTALVFLRSWIGDDRERLEALFAALERRLQQVGAATDPAVLELAAQVADRLGRREAAQAHWERVLERRPQDLGVLWRCAHLDLDLGRWESARALFDRIVQHPQGGGELVQAQRIAVLMHLGRHDEALEELARLERASAAGAGPPVAVQALLYELAWEMWDAGRQPEARALWKRVAQGGEPAAAAAISPAAELQDLGGMRAAALEALVHLLDDPQARQQIAAGRSARAESAVGSNPFGDLNRAAQLLAAGDLEPAFDLLGAVTEELPDSEEAWLNLGLAAFRLERWEEAARAYGRAAELNPERPQSRFQRGIALHNLDRCADTVEPLERGLALDPTHWQSHYYLARCYDQLGQPERAQRSWQAYREAKSAAEP